jgi:hypothetical protein
MYTYISGEIENNDGLSVYKESDDQWEAYTYIYMYMYTYIYIYIYIHIV